MDRQDVNGFLVAKDRVFHNSVNVEGGIMFKGKFVASAAIGFVVVFSFVVGLRTTTYAGPDDVDLCNSCCVTYCPEGGIEESGHVRNLAAGGWVC